MKKLVQTVTAFLLAFAMIAAPAADAQTRGRGGNSTSSGATAPNRPSNNGGNRPSHSANRPGHSTSRPANPSSGNQGNANRPSGGGQSGSSRPGNSGESHFRPGNNNGNHGNNTGGNHNRPDNNHPGNNNNHYRPANNHGHGQQPPQQMRPQGHGPQHWQGPSRPPMPPRHDRHFHHHVPFFGTFSRPVPPPRWHYAGGGPTFGTILGVALGTAIGASINALVNHGYSVSSYGNDVVYLNNVPQMNFYWPDAALYYTNGVLTGSQFTYPSGFYDMSRYNSLYNTFSMQYGMPVQTVNNGGVISATWYGAGGRYVNLSFNSNYAGSYYTTLSFGN